MIMMVMTMNNCCMRPRKSFAGLIVKIAKKRLIFIFFGSWIWIAGRLRILRY